MFNYTDPSQPFLGEAQGIALFDGMHNDFIIENNLVVTDNWHGMALQYLGPQIVLSIIIQLLKLTQLGLDHVGFRLQKPKMVRQVQEILYETI